MIYNLGAVKGIRYKDKFISHLQYVHLFIGWFRAENISMKVKKE